MARIPDAVTQFLSGKHLAVAGVSRTPNQAANAIFRKLKASGFEVFPINPNAVELEGARCYEDVGSVPGPIDGVVIATHPDAATDIVRQCAEHDIGRVWFHRSFGQGSVSEEAVAECRKLGVDAIVGGCPLMFCEPVDIGHKCMKWWLQKRGRVPG